MKLKTIIKTEQPRERLIRQGPEVLSDSELLAIILRSGTKKENVLQLAQKIISIPFLNELTYQELIQKQGIGESKACQILALLEFAKREHKTKDKKKITSSKDALEILSKRLKKEKQEHFIALYLNTKNELIAKKTITIGTIDASIVHPREVFTTAVKVKASSIILVHNHPSGDPKPSPEDYEVTNKLKKASELLSIDLLDHIIIGEKGHFSFYEEVFCK